MDLEKKYTVTFSQNNACLTTCRKLLKLSMHKYQSYYLEQKGFYIESSDKYM